MKKLHYIIVLIIFGFLSCGFRDRTGFSDLNQEQWLNFLYLIGVLVLVSTSIIPRFTSEGVNFTFLSAFAWIFIFAAIIAFYAYKDDISSSKFASALFPDKATKLTDGSLMFSAQENGHFYVKAYFNYKEINCLVDTGASEVLIDTKMANNIGIEISSLSFNSAASTANGMVNTASYILQDFTIGNINMKNFKIMVNNSDMNNLCLLGMTFLNSLSSFSFKGNTLILNP